MDKNQVIIRGKIEKEPRIEETYTGKQVMTFSIATIKKYRDNMGNEKQHTQFHRVVAWNKLAEDNEKLCKKGREVEIKGELQTRIYQGEKLTEVVASEINFE